MYLYPVFGNLGLLRPTGQSGRLVFTFHGSDDADSRKDVPFWAIVDITLYLGSQIAPKPQFLGRE